MNILVTGGAGFIRSNLASALVGEHDVTVLDNFHTGNMGSRNLFGWRVDKMMAMMTGCAGFVCSHLTEQSIGGGFNVTEVNCFTDYGSRDYKDGNLKNALKDILSTDAFPDLNCVLCHSAQAGVQKSWANSDGNRELKSRKGSEDLLNDVRNRW